MKKRFLALALGTLAFGVTLGGVKMGLGHQDAMMVKAAETDSKRVTFNAAVDKTAPLDKDGFSISVQGGCTLDNGQQYRFNKGSIVSISTTLEKVEIVKIVFTCTANGNAKYGPGGFSIVGEGTYAASTGKTGTWTGASSVAKLEASGAQVRATEIAITYQTIKEAAEIDSISLEMDKTSFVDSQFKGNEFNTTGLTVNALFKDPNSGVESLNLKDVEWFVKADPSDPAYIPLLDEKGLIADSLNADAYCLFAKYGDLYSTDSNVILIVEDKILAESIAVSVESTSFKVRESTMATAVVSPETATDKTVNWHVVDGSVASIDSTGKVTGLKAGKTQIYATAKDKGAVESNKVEITVTEYEAKTYHQIVAEQVDYSGTYLLGYKASATEVYTWNGKDDVNGFNTATFADDVLTGNEQADASYIVLDRLFDGKTLKGYTAKLVDGTGAELYFNHTDNSNGFTLDAEKKACYQVEFAEDGVDIFVPNGPHLRFNSASNQMRFRFYKSSTYGEQQPVQLYRLDYTADVAVNAKAFADKFVAAPICGTDDNTPANADEFEKFVTEYSGLSRDVRAYLANRDDESDASFKAFYNKYDAIMEKRASNTEFYDFLAGKYRPAKTQGVFGINQNITDSTTWSLVGIGAVTIAASASLLFFRRKKSN